MLAHKTKRVSHDQSHTYSDSTVGSLIPRSAPVSVFDSLQNAKIEKEGLGENIT